LAVGGVLLISGVGPVASGRARTLVVHQPGIPQTTLTVPAGWRAEARGRYVRVVRRRARVAVRVCPLDRAERDMTGRHFTAVWVRPPGSPVTCGAGTASTSCPWPAAGAS